MSCYMRHMAWLMDALELENDSSSRKRVDMAIREALGMDPDAVHCPEVWAAIKGLPEDERLTLVPRVGEILGRE